jgi:hypothetical protein
MQPLTFQQQWLNVLCRPEDLLTRLDQVFAVRLSGRLDKRLLGRSLAEVVRRHGALRTRIVEEDGTFGQVVAEPAEWELETLHIPIDSAAADPSEAARQVIARFARQTRNLRMDAPFDVKLLELAETEHILCWGISHYVSDGWSLNLIMREVWSLYGQLLRGREIPAVTPPQYSDYQAWQRTAHQAWSTTQGAYWKVRLGDASGIRWPTDSTRLESEPDAFVNVEVAFSAALTAAVRDRAKSRRTLAGLILMTAYVAAVSRWCDQEDFIVTTLVHGRDRLEHQSIIGFLAHPVYMRMQINRNDPLERLLSQVSQEYYRSLSRKDFGGVVTEHLDLMSGSIVQWVPWGQNELSGAPTESEAREIGLTGSSVWFVDDDQPFPTATLCPLFWSNPERLFGTVWYPARRFARSSVECFAQELHACVRRLVE